MEWLCDSWRYRFNTLRSREWKYWYINEDNRYNTGVHPTPGEPSAFKRKSLSDNPAPEWMNDVLNETNDAILILMNYDDSTDYCRKIADHILLSRWTPSGEQIPSNIHITTL